jgi:2-oxo-4-hydroxy-4-carboxy-5-ureidoimidazoline decarboxylase
MSATPLRTRIATLSRAEFVAIFGPIYEHSPWVAEGVFDRGIGHQNPQTLQAAMAAVVEAAPRERQLNLLRAHPDLAGRLAMADALSAHSASEQAQAGLDSCSPEEFDRFTSLNAAYKAKFGFPFIMAVKGRSRGEILSAFEHRIENDPSVEFRTALDQVHKIASFRIRELLAGQP